MRIYPVKGFLPSQEDYHQLACAALKFGLSARVGREKTKSGVRRYVELLGIEKAAASGSNTDDGNSGNHSGAKITQEET